MMQIQQTPNPDALKFIASDTLSEQALDFQNSQQTHSSPLAKTILGFPWAKQVCIYKNFITITKEEWADWETLKDPLISLIQEYINSQNVVISKKISNQTSYTPSSKIEKEIQKIIQTEIQPAVQMDGGFIEFSHYQKGRVYLRLKGACSGCPSAEWTLKEGIEKRLKQSIAEVQEVIAI